jgi:hypothetical protein
LVRRDGSRQNSRGIAAILIAVAHPKPGYEASHKAILACRGYLHAAKQEANGVVNVETLIDFGQKRAIQLLQRRRRQILSKLA